MRCTNNAFGHIFTDEFSFQNWRSAVLKNRLDSFYVSTKLTIKSCHDGFILSASLDKLQHRFYLTGGVDGKVGLYDLQNTDGGKCARKNVAHAQRGQLPMVSSVQWYPVDLGMFVSSTTKGSVAIWDTNAFAPVISYDIDKIVHCSNIRNINNAAPIIAIGTAFSEIKLCDIVTGCGFNQSIPHAHTGGVSSVDWCPLNENILISSSYDGSVKMWDIRKSSRGPLSVFDFNNYTASTEASQSLIFKGSNRFHEWVPEAKESVMSSGHQVRAHRAKVHCVRYSPCGNYVITSGADGLKKWNAHNGQLCDTIASRSNEFSSQHFSTQMEFITIGGNLAAHSTYLLAPYGVNNIGLWPLGAPAAHPIHLLRGHCREVFTIQVRNTMEKQVISTSKDGLIIVWDMSMAPKAQQPQQPLDSAVPSSTSTTSTSGGYQYRVGSSRNGAFPMANEQDSDNWSDDEDPPPQPPRGRQFKRRRP